MGIIEIRLPAISTLYSVPYCPFSVESAMGSVILERSVSISSGQIAKESERLSGLVEELLDFSRIQSGRMTLR